MESNRFKGKLARWVVSQPHFWKSVRMTLTLPKQGLGSPLGLPKLQSSIARVKTQRLDAFFMSLESYWSVNVRNGLTWVIWTSIAQVMAIWVPTTKSQESTRPRCVQVECNTPLESSQGELQVYFRSHPNQRYEQRVINSQSPESPNWDSFETPLWESWDKKPFGCGCHGIT